MPGAGSTVIAIVSPGWAGCDSATARVPPPNVPAGAALPFVITHAS